MLLNFPFTETVHWTKDDRPDMTLDVYRGRKTTNKENGQKMNI